MACKRKKRRYGMDWHKRKVAARYNPRCKEDVAFEVLLCLVFFLAFLGLVFSL